MKLQLANEPPTVQMLSGAESNEDVVIAELEPPVANSNFRPKSGGTILFKEQQILHNRLSKDRSIVIKSPQQLSSSKSGSKALPSPHRRAASAH